MQNRERKIEINKQTKAIDKELSFLSTPVPLSADTPPGISPEMAKKARDLMKKKDTLAQERRALRNTL